jgi:hypothetical protein
MGCTFPTTTLPSLTVVSHSSPQLDFSYDARV